MSGIIQGREVHRSMGFQGHRSVSRHDGSTKDGWYSYICGHCNTKVSGAVVWGYYEDEEPPIKWILCPNCGNGSVLAKDGNVYPGVPFGPNIEDLEEQGFVTPPMKGLVDLIRRHGNKATHSLESPDKKRAESTLMFTAELLRLIYEMEHLSKQYTEET